MSRISLKTVTNNNRAKNSPITTIIDNFFKGAELAGDVWWAADAQINSVPT
jgi:hypothetical protein